MNINIVILLIILLVIINSYTSYENYSNKIKEPCSYSLSDEEYLIHMIPHHQVAVDISLMLQKISKNPIMQTILRTLIWTQKYEIELMKSMLNKLPNKVSRNDKMNNNYIITTANLTSPNKIGLTKTYCDPHFFNPDEHMKHMKHMKLTDKSYIKHMIPHHQVAVDMSKKLLKNTNNDFMIHLAYRIIRSQESEIILLNDLLDKNNYFNNKNIIQL